MGKFPPGVMLAKPSADNYDFLAMVTRLRADDMPGLPAIRGFYPN